MYCVIVRSRRRFRPAALALTTLLTTAIAASDWPQWRGPSRDGLVSNADWPSDLSRLERVWRVDLGPSYSGPVLAGNLVFTTETRDGSVEVVTALDRDTGQVRWQQSWEGFIKVPFFAKANGDWIRSTPAVDDGRLYVAGMRDVLVCIEAATGRVLWRVDFVKEAGAPVPAFGFVSSPLVVGDAVYVQAGAAFAKLDKRTGAVQWRTLEDGGGMYGSAFSSPVRATLAGREQLVVQTRDKLAGVDPWDGRVLWEQPVKAFRGMNILTPVVVGDGIFTTAYGGRAHLFTVQVREGGFEVRETWNSRAEGYMSTPVVIGDHAYLHLRRQQMTCLDLSSGQERWRTDRKFGKYWSLIASGARILALDQDGTLYLMAANPRQFELLDSRKVSDGESWAHLAIDGRRLYVRELEGLTALDWDRAVDPKPNG